MTKFGDPSFNTWNVIARTSPFFCRFWHFDPKWPWRSRSNSTIYNPNWDLSDMHLLVQFGEPRFAFSKVIVRTSPFLADFNLFDPIWPWRSRSNHSTNNPNREPPRSVLSKVIVRTNNVLRTDGQTDRRTDRQTDRQTDRRTDGQTQATAIPLGHTGWGVKMHVTLYT